VDLSLVGVADLAPVGVVGLPVELEGLALVGLVDLAPVGVVGLPAGVAGLVAVADLT